MNISTKLGNYFDVIIRSSLHLIVEFAGHKFKGVRECALDISHCINFGTKRAVEGLKYVV